MRTRAARPEPQNRSGAADQQQEWFGRSLGDLFSSVMEVCGLTQAQLGEALGLSAPMVSQLISGRRIKPGNPQVQERIVELGHALSKYEEHAIAAPELRARVEELSHSGPARSATMSALESTVTDQPTSTAHILRAVFAAVASATEIDAIALTIEKKYPDVAELLRTCGAGRTADAVRFLRTHGLA